MESLAGRKAPVERLVVPDHIGPPVSEDSADGVDEELAEAYELVHDWHRRFHGTYLRKPEGVVRCQENPKEILGHVRVIQSRTVLGLGFPQRGFDRFVLLLTKRGADPVGHLASFRLDRAMCPKHPYHAPVDQIAAVLRRARNEEGRTFTVKV